MTQPKDVINFCNFNQDFSCLAVGTRHGYRIYNCDPFGKCYEKREGNVSIIEMLFSTSLIAVILSPRRLQILNTKRNSIICELTFPSAVLAVKLNRKRLAVVLEDQIYLYDISNMKLLHTIETSPNAQAVCALSPSSENGFLVYPLPIPAASTSFSPPSHAPPNSNNIVSITGDVLIFDSLKIEALNVIEAHKSPLSCLALSNDGRLLASASDKGTIIRVFSLPQGNKLFQFRRGAYPSKIFSMNFNTGASLLAVSSATETVHLFRLAISPDRQEANNDTSFTNAKTNYGRSASPGATDIPRDEFLSSADNFVETKKRNGMFTNMIRRSSQTIGKSMADAVGNYLPSAVTEMWDPQRDFAFLKLPSTGLRTVVAVGTTSPHVMVVTSEGILYVYILDMEKGGECLLTQQYSLREADDKLGMLAVDNP